MGRKSWAVWGLACLGVLGLGVFSIICVAWIEYSSGTQPFETKNLRGPGTIARSLDGTQPPIVYMGMMSDANPRGRGVVAVEVVTDSPADDAGLTVGDIITKADGLEVTNRADLVKALSPKRAGDTIRLEIQRDSKTLQLEITLENRPSDVNAALKAHGDAFPVTSPSSSR